MRVLYLFLKPDEIMIEWSWFIEQKSYGDPQSGANETDRWVELKLSKVHAIDVAPEIEEAAI